MKMVISSIIGTVVLMILAASSIFWYISLQSQFSKDLKQLELKDVAESVAASGVDMVSVVRASSSQSLLMMQMLNFPQLEQGYYCELLVTVSGTAPKTYSFSIVVGTEAEPRIQTTVDMPFSQISASNIFLLSEGPLGSLKIVKSLHSGSSLPYIVVKKEGASVYLGLGVKQLG